MTQVCSCSFIPLARARFRAEPMTRISQSELSGGTLEKDRNFFLLDLLTGGTGVWGCCSHLAYHVGIG